MSADLLANVERAPSDRPPSATPALPDIPAPNDYPFAGSATSDVQRWKRRAIAAEALVDRLLGALRAWRPHT